MGNPLSPVLADLVMGTLIANVMLKVGKYIKVLKKYVDDLFLIVQADQLHEVLHAFNSYHNSLQFTCEQESQGMLPYLDLTVIRQSDDTIKTQWYIKPIASGRMLNFHSMHPMNQKINVIYNFINRVYSLSTNLTDHEKREIVTTNLLMNDYPKNLINRCLTRINNTQQNDTNTSVENNNETIYRSLPYIATLTPRITKLIRKNYPNVSIIAKNNNTISNLYTRIKDPLPMNHRHNLVYRLQCKDCNSTYTGMTSNLLKTRMCGHQSDQNKLERLLASGHSYTDETVRTLREKTALIAHCIDHEHRFDLTKPVIVDETHKKSTLPFLEMIWIHNEETNVNKRTDTEGLNTNYTEIINKIHTQSRNKNRHTQTNRTQQ